MFYRRTMKWNVTELDHCPRLTLPCTTFTYELNRDNSCYGRITLVELQLEMLTVYDTRENRKINKSPMAARLLLDHLVMGECKHERSWRVSTQNVLNETVKRVPANSKRFANKIHANVNTYANACTFSRSHCLGYKFELVTAYSQLNVSVINWLTVYVNVWMVI